MNAQERENRHRMETRLQALGFTFEEIGKLRRISMTLRNWYALEAGTEHGRIERNENEKPFFVREYRDTFKPYTLRTLRTPTADREKGAIKRLEKIMQAHAGLTYYLQTDCRGAALYILAPGDVPQGKSASAYYTNGAVVF